MQIQVTAALIAVVLASTALADLNQKINLLNAAVKGAASGQSECNTCEVGMAGGATTDPSTVKTCIEKICPNRDWSIPGVHGKVEERFMKSDPVFSKEILPLIAGIAEEEARSDLSGSRIMSDWLQNPPPVKSPGAIRFLNLIQAMQDFEKFKFKSVNGSMAVDHEKSRETFKGLSDDQFKKKAAITQKFVDVFFKGMLPQVDPARLDLAYGEGGFRLKVNETLATFKSKKAAIEADPDLGFIMQLPTVQESFSGDDLKARFEESETINTALIDQLNLRNAMLNVYSAAATDSEFKKLLDSDPIDIKKIASEMKARDLIEQTLKKASLRLSKKDPAVLQKCAFVYAAGQEVLPSQQQLDEFKKRVPALKARFLEKTRNLVCLQNRKKYEEEVGKWMASFPLTREQHFANLKKSLSEELNDQRKSPQRQKDALQSKARNDLLAIGLMQLPERSKSKEMSPADRICEKLAPDILPDATTPGSDKFVTGPLVITHPNSEGITFHELGHRLYYFLKKNGENCEDKDWFAKARSCLFSLHSEFTKEEQAAQSQAITKGEGTKYESEDWADLVSAQVDEKGDNFACFLSRGLKDEDYKGIGLRNPKSSDDHSSHFFRTLHLNFLKNGKVPEICEQALASGGESSSFKNCLAQ